MESKIISTDKIDNLANEYVKLEEQYMRTVGMKVWNGFYQGSITMENLFINAFYKSCDDLGIGYEKQQQILEGIKLYINR